MAVLEALQQQAVPHVVQAGLMGLTETEEQQAESEALVVVHRAVISSVVIPAVATQQMEVMEIQVQQVLAILPAIRALLQRQAFIIRLPDNRLQAAMAVAVAVAVVVAAAVRELAAPVHADPFGVMVVAVAVAVAVEQVEQVVLAVAVHL